MPGRFPLITDENISGPLVQGLRSSSWDVVRAGREDLLVDGEAERHAGADVILLSRRRDGGGESANASWIRDALRSVERNGKAAGEVIQPPGRR